jgi:hypothetical protein
MCRSYPTAVLDLLKRLVDKTADIAIVARQWITFVMRAVDLLHGVKPNMPPAYGTFKLAERADGGAESGAVQSGLFDDAVYGTLRILKYCPLLKSTWKRSWRRHRIREVLISC